ncbi:MAG TPA: hypothetical protein VIP11_05675 [Gemmatimonadaceae bacterium]
MKKVVWFPWFTEEEWAKLRAVAPDADQFQPTFEEWRAVVEKTITDADGVQLRRVPISVAALLAWCDARGRRPDFTARTEYTAAECHRLHESSRGDA